jgi:hypothetical protein
MVPSFAVKTQPANAVNTLNDSISSTATLRQFTGFAKPRNKTDIGTQNLDLTNLGERYAVTPLN